MENKTLEPTNGNQEQNLTKREQFAMAAIQGLLAATGYEFATSYEQVAKEAVQAADALIRALNS